MTCPKTGYSSAEKARRAHRRAGFRLRAYKCPDCARWHVTNTEKRHSGEGLKNR